MCSQLGLGGRIPAMHPSHCSGGALPPLACSSCPPLPHRLEGALQSLYLRVLCQAWHHLDFVCGQRQFRLVDKRNLLACAERGLIWLGAGGWPGVAPSFMVTIICQVLLPIWEPKKPCPAGYHRGRGKRPQEQCHEHKLACVGGCVCPCCLFMSVSLDVLSLWPHDVALPPRTLCQEWSHISSCCFGVVCFSGLSPL